MEGICISLATWQGGFHPSESDILVQAQADVQQLEDQPAPAELERDELDESLSRWDERFQQEPKRDQQKERR